MTLIDEIKRDKIQLQADIAKLIQDFEDKYDCLSVGNIDVYKGQLTGPLYGKVVIGFPIHIHGMTTQ